jgi:uncharacterized protein
MMVDDIPFLGVGLGYRRQIKSDILAAPERVDLLELIADQFMDRPRSFEQEAKKIIAKFPVILHGVGLSLGTDCNLSMSYLERLSQVVELFNPYWVSDHICFTGVPGSDLGQLTPISFNDTNVDIIVNHIKQVAGMFDRPFLVENISYLFNVPPATMTEAGFITRIIMESDAWLLLDLANLENNAVNHNYDPFEYLDQIPLDRVIQLHLAGSSFKDGLLIDSHSHPVRPKVIELLKYALPRMPMLKGIIIERDQNFPRIEQLFAELDMIREVVESYCDHHAVR